jgi:TonB-linked SusC/RagA family outer membrane protein
MSYLVSAPNMPLYDDNGTIYWVPDMPDFTAPLRSRHFFSENISNTFLASLSAGYRIVNDLEMKIDMGYTRTYLDEFSSYGNGYMNPYADNSYTNRVLLGNSSMESINIEPQLNYSRIFGEGRLSALLGATWQSQEENRGYSDLRDFPAETFFRDASAAPLRYGVRTNNEQYKYASLFGRLTYDLRNRYVINGIVRRDGSSRFFRERRFGNFWSVGAGWIFSREKFFKIPFVSYGKLRGSYGVTGNDNVGNYMYLETYASSQYSYNGVTGLYPNQVANPDFSWEITRKAELALELGLFKDRLTATAALYLNRSNNQLVAYPLASQSGFTSLRSNLNGALIQNRGLEIELYSQNISTKDFKWNTSFNFTLPENKLLDYPGLNTSSYATVYETGKALNVTRLYKFTGVDPTNGAPVVLDVNRDGRITSTDDRLFQEDTDPDFYGGLYNSLSFRNFQLDFLIQFVSIPFRLGWLNNYTYPVGYLNKNVPREIYENTWTPENRDAKYPGMATTTASGSKVGYPYYAYYTSSDAIYSNASFARMKNISLSYRIPRTLTSRIGMRDIQVYARTQNLFTITGFSNWDPETGSSVPPAQTLVLGFKFLF